VIKRLAEPGDDCLGVLFKVFGRDAEHVPAQSLELVASSAVCVEFPAAVVISETVRFDTHEGGGIGEVEAGDKSLAVTDDILKHRDREPRISQ
jgi:hypothetical protein